MSKAQYLRGDELNEISSIATQAARPALVADADPIANEIELMIDDVAEPKINDLFEQRWVVVQEQVDRAPWKAIKAGGDVRLDLVARSGGSFFALKSGPSECPGPDWQMIAGR